MFDSSIWLVSMFDSSISLVNMEFTAWCQSMQKISHFPVSISACSDFTNNLKQGRWNIHYETDGLLTSIYFLITLIFGFFQSQIGIFQCSYEGAHISYPKPLPSHALETNTTCTDSSTLSRSVAPSIWSPIAKHGVPLAGDTNLRCNIHI